MDNTTEMQKNARTKEEGGVKLKQYILDLESKIKNLKILCDTLDPYAKISLDKKSELLSLGIKVLDNPFTITNQLLLMMEDSIVELEKLKNNRV